MGFKRTENGSVPGMGQESLVPGAGAAGEHRRDPGLEAAGDPTLGKRAGKVRRHEDIAANPYATSRRERLGLDSRGIILIALGAALLLALTAAIVLPSGWFDVNYRGMTLAQWMHELNARVAGIASVLTRQDGGTYGMGAVICRYHIVALAGAALGISGAVYQGALKNALASPTTLGVISGCNAGRMVYVLFFIGAAGVASSGRISDISAQLSSLSVPGYLFAVYGMALFSLIGGGIVVLCVLGISFAAGRGRMSSVGMVIVGQIFTTVITAGVTLVQYYLTETGDYRAQLLRSMQVETFAYTFRGLDLLLVGIPVVLGIAYIIVQGQRLNLLAFSEDEARSIGLSTTRQRALLVGVCTVLTAVIVAFCGAIGMVGFLVPHLVRKVVGPHLSYLLPASALTGALFLVVSYFIASLFSGDILASFGVFVSLIGGAVFLVIALMQRRNARGDWL